MRLLITGANGFVARRLICRLTELNHSVTGYDIRQPIPSLPCEFIEDDLCQGEKLASIDWESYDAVVHLAAAGVRTPTRTWPLCSEVNILGTQRLLYALSTTDNPPLLIHARSFYERHLWDDNNSFHDNPYVVTKHLSTQLVRLWAEQIPVRRVIFATIFQAYGPGSNNDSVLSYAADCLCRKKEARFGSGNGLRDWIYVDDLVEAMIKSMDSAKDKTWSGIREYDLGTGIITSLKDVIMAMAKECNCEDLLTFDPRLDRDDTALRDAAVHFVPDWQPKIDLKAGTRLLLKSFE